MLLVVIACLKVLCQDSGVSYAGEGGTLMIDMKPSVTFSASILPTRNPRLLRRPLNVRAVSASSIDCWFKVSRQSLPNAQRLRVPRTPARSLNSGGDRLFRFAL